MNPLSLLATGFFIRSGMNLYDNLEKYIHKKYNILDCFMFGIMTFIMSKLLRYQE
jgi:hypothetical protein